MVDSTKNTIRDISKLFEECREKINSHIHDLKIVSSEEVLNGSIEEAQKILNQILPIEIAANKIIQHQNEFIKIIKSEHIEKSSVSNGSNYIQKNLENPNASNEFKASKNFLTQIELRVSILKALIYLGGNASVKEVLGFIEKDLRKKFGKGDLEIQKDSGEKRWEAMVKKERVVMEAEGLLNEHKTNGTWIIVQNGIDYLSNHGK